MSSASSNQVRTSANIGLALAVGFGAVGVGLMIVTTPFVLPALRKYCLPYLPATEKQLDNLSLAFKRYSRRGDNFLDIGSGDGRICRLAAQTNLYTKVHGIELNSVLVYYSRLLNLGSGHSNIRYFHRDLWKFPVNQYESLCIFGVDSMMDPLKRYIVSTSRGRQLVFACRFPFEGLRQIDEIGAGIDTVWVYEITRPEVDVARNRS